VDAGIVVRHSAYAPSTTARFFLLKLHSQGPKRKNGMGVDSRQCAKPFVAGGVGNLERRGAGAGRSVRTGDQGLTPGNPLVLPIAVPGGPPDTSILALHV
jgi:hypothetical protein